MEETNKKIMIAIDDSECSLYALKWALKNLHDKLASSGVILYVAIPVDYSAILAGTYGAAPPELLKSIEDNQAKFADGLLEKAKEICAKDGIAAEALSEFGNPKEAICNAVEKFDVQLLVVGNQGRGAVQRALLGSVSGYCVQHAKCPVLVVKKPHD
ncbi:hypothetical protein Ancab_018512 [Ancistrocladus abbreviatus]